MLLCALHVLQLHATVHGYAGDVRGAATKRHDCARPSAWESRAQSWQHHALLLRPTLALLFSGANLPRYRRRSIDVCAGAEIVVPVRNFGPFSRTRTSQSSKSTYPTNRIGGIQPIPKSTYCPGSHIERLTCKPGQRELSRYAKNTRFRKPGQ